VHKEQISASDSHFFGQGCNFVPGLTTVISVLDRVGCRVDLSENLISRLCQRLQRWADSITFTMPPGLVIGMMMLQTSMQAALSSLKLPCDRQQLQSSLLAIAARRHARGLCRSIIPPAFQQVHHQLQFCRHIRGRARCCLRCPQRSLHGSGEVSKRKGSKIASGRRLLEVQKHLQKAPSSTTKKLPRRYDELRVLFCRGSVPQTRTVCRQVPVWGRHFATKCLFGHVI
jgi:hypothetical protein